MCLVISYLYIKLAFGLLIATLAGSMLTCCDVKCKVISWVSLNAYIGFNQPLLMYNG